jgi:hypothetical protein
MLVLCGISNRRRRIATEAVQRDDTSRSQGQCRTGQSLWQCASSSQGGIGSSGIGGRKSDWIETCENESRAIHIGARTWSMCSDMKTRVLVHFHRNQQMQILSAKQAVEIWRNILNKAEKYFYWPGASPQTKPWNTRWSISAMVSSQSFLSIQLQFDSENLALAYHRINASNAALSRHGASPSNPSFPRISRSSGPH